jgi:arylsulfatase A-like enzyme
LTGRLPIRYGIAANATRVRVNIWNSTPNGLPRSELTFAKVLQKEGYKTALVGKWHLGKFEHTLLS